MPNSTTDIKTILVIRSSAMGDVAMTVPVLRVLCDVYGAQVRIVMLTRDFFEPFFDGLPIELFNVDLYEQHSGVKGVFRLFNELSEKYKFDAILDLNYKLYSRLLKRLFWYRGVPTYHIDKGREEKKMLTRTKHKVVKQLKTSVERYADVFRLAGFDITMPNVLPARVKHPIPQFAGEKTGRWVGIAPFAKHEGKILPYSTIRATIEELYRTYPDVRIFIFGGGRAEHMIAESFVAWYPCCVSTIGKTNLRGEIDLMSNLDVMLSMDSSAMHMSSLVGLSVVSVWGATHPAAGFLGFGQSVDDVVSVDMECRPCSVYGHKPCERMDYACMNRITVRMITEKLAVYL